jgi:Cu2+-containing amine oxidase
MKTITKFILGFPMLALAWGSIAFAQVPLEPLIPPDSAFKAMKHPLTGGGDRVRETVEFKSKSKWHLTVNAVNKFGLVITGASFQKSPTSPWVYVLHDGRLAEIFVPYHTGSPNYRDISFFNFKPLKLDPAKFLLPGSRPGDFGRQIIGSDELICKEVRNYLAWMDAFGDNAENPLVRYGQEVVYFSVLRAAYYAYIMEWTFRDDGTILVRAGSTGPKKDAEGHIHNFTWRLDIDLNGASANSAYWTRHSEDLTAPFGAADYRVPIEVEGSRVWNPEQFNTLEIGDARLRNGRGNVTSYELVPMRSGTARHYNPLFPWTQADFWVTQYNPSQLQAVNGLTGQDLDGSPFSSTPLLSLPDYILDAKPTTNKDLVIWYTGSEHHEGAGTGDPSATPSPTKDSRDEDRNTVPILWTGFELDPHNLFDGTPFYPSEE